MLFFDDEKQRKIRNLGDEVFRSAGRHRKLTVRVPRGHELHAAQTKPSREARLGGGVERESDTSAAQQELRSAARHEGRGGEPRLCRSTPRTNPTKALSAT